MSRKGRPGESVLSASGRAVRKGNPVAEALREESRHFTGRQYRKSVELLEDILCRKDLKPRQRFEALCRKAESLERMGRSRAALEILRAVTRSYSGEPLGFSLLGECLFRVSEDSAGAMAALGRALELSPDDPDTHWWRGQVWQYGIGEPRKARDCYLLALRADSRHAPAMESLAVLAESQGKWIEAVDWRKSHYLIEKKGPLLSAIAGLYLRLGNLPAAQKYSASAIRRSPRDASAWLVRAKALAAAGMDVQGAGALIKYDALAGMKTGPAIYSRDMYWLESLLSDPRVIAIVGKRLAQ